MKMKFGIARLPFNWRDWRFGFVVRQPRPYGTDINLSFGPLAIDVWWRRWPK